MDKIIFIDDDADVRETYKLSMEMMFGDKFEVVCLDVEPSLAKMIQILEDIPDKVTYFVDENLKHSGKANYSGIELIENIRINNSKIPIYILTSTADDIDEYLGDIEFVIDKNDWESEDEEQNLPKRFLRHINTFLDIKSSQAKRFDELFEKSLFSGLSEDELNEFNVLNVGRSKILSDEALVSEESLSKLRDASEKLNEIYEQLKGGKSDS